MNQHNKYKKFISIDAQIDLLKSRGLKVNDKQLLSYYLKKYNYQNFVNGYNDLLFVNEQRITNKYKENVSENELIAIFNFDRAISSIILNSILDIERNISSILTTIICESFNNKQENYGLILDCSIDDFKRIFDRKFKNKTDKQTEILIEQTKTILTEWFFKNKNEKLFKKYKDNPPLWVLSIYWSFGNIKELINNCLSNFLINKLIKNLPKQLWDVKHNELFSLMNIINKLRNRCCHNNVVYNFETKFNKKVLGTIMSKSRIKIYDLVLILDTLQNKSASTKHSLSKCFDKKINDYFSKINPDLKQIILNSMNYTKKP